ncbi:conserved protein of unknown function [Nitrospira japonica]|uniref:Uncharacterized protein n=1 Tax=Nitrospira japonica TaxID=1325564 RepID=A0A1W1I8U0_9BACT|nr:hypothetical protein [Nitrospira japonica]SLM49341.1 conserved protein of unknown function [Nitrospira japonica]
MHDQPIFMGKSAAPRRSKQILTSLVLCLMPVLSGCGLIQGMTSFLSPASSAKPRSPSRDSVIERLMPAVRPDVQGLPEQVERDSAGAAVSGETVPARFKRRVILDALNRPWDGLADLEGHGLLAAELSEGGAVNLPGVLDVLEAGMDRTSTFHKAIPLPTGPRTEAVMRFMVDSLAEASQHRDKALSGLSEDERGFLFAHAARVVERFSPQISNLTEQTLSPLKEDARFSELIEERVDHANLIAAAQVLARLANERWLHHLAGTMSKPLPSEKVPSGVTGDVLYVEDSSYGLIVVGGSGANTYELDSRFGLVIDLGGDDLYGGMIAASTDRDHGNAVVIDAAGNDRYESRAFGLAAGRLGVGLLIDLAGDDVYHLAQGSGGTGFGGIGILFDAKGNDEYVGSRMTQGAALHGLGLLLDMAGNDRYTSHGFAIGFGGPSGIGAVIDVQGDDRYQCGGKYPSAYNAEDAPNGKPGDPMFQYDCFGLGTGSGGRVLSRRAERQAYSSAGGWGLLVDVAGSDHYESDNFSQGHGYFFGAGVLLDLDGNDQYHAARYGQGSSAHYGVGFFNDRRGDDHYGSSGPFYNGGVAWDHAVSLMIDSDKGRDQYLFDRSTGLGSADHSGWGLFIDEGGDDQYGVKGGFGRANEKSVSAFFDLGGIDMYRLPPDTVLAPDQRPVNGKVVVYPHDGGLFIDR